MSTRSRPAGDQIVLTPPPAARRRRDVRFVGLFLVFALPVGAVLWAIIDPWIALAYVVGQTAFLTYGLRRRHTPTLRLDAEGLSYEPGRFQLRCGWDAVTGVERVDLPTGPVEAFTLRASGLHWAADARVRDEVRQRGWDRQVPVGDFEVDWRHGRIGEAVRRWAPHVT